jgi:hypothetical protein
MVVSNSPFAINFANVHISRIPNRDQLIGGGMFRFSPILGTAVELMSISYHNELSICCSGVGKT